MVTQNYAVKVEKSIEVAKPKPEVYQFWRNLENLPRIMSHLEAVDEIDSLRSHWRAKAPAGKDVEWDAQILRERENEEISWESVANSEIRNSGTVRFTDTSAGTKVTVELLYEPPAGKVGVIVARIFGKEPSQEIDHDLKQFKTMIESESRPGLKEEDELPLD